MLVCKIPAGTQVYLTVIRDAVADKLDVIGFEYSYLNQSFPVPWAYWKFDEESGPRVDATGHGHDFLDTTYRHNSWGPNTYSSGSIGGVLTNITDWWRQYFYWDGADWQLLFETHYNGTVPSGQQTDTFPQEHLDFLNSNSIKNVYWRVRTYDGNTYWDGGTPQILVALNPSYNQYWTAIINQWEHTNVGAWCTNYVARQAGVTITSTDAGMSYGAGKIGNAARMTDINVNPRSHPELSIPYPSGFPELMTNKPWTLAFWFKHDASSDGGSYLLDVNSPWEIWMYPVSGEIEFMIGAGDAWPDVYPHTTFDEWHFVVMCYDGTTFRFYIDMELKASVEGDCFTWSTGDSDLYLWEEERTGKSGWIDLMGVWTDQCLTPDQIVYLWNNGNGRSLY